MEVRADLGMILSQLKVTQFLMFQVSENVSRVVTVGHGSLLHNNCDTSPLVNWISMGACFVPYADVSWQAELGVML